MSYYKCPYCGWSRELKKGLYLTCPECSSPLIIEVQPRGKLISKNTGIWRYSNFLPNFHVKPTLGEGGTFLSNAKRLREKLRLRNLYVKDEGRNPTGAFTDRGAAIVVAATLYYGYRKIISKVPGDVAASLAAYSAAYNLDFTTFFNESFQLEKLYQVALFGGKIVDKEEEAGEGYKVRPGDPFLIEGYKTISFEIYEALGEVDTVIAPIGHGSLVYSLWKGFKELQDVYNVRVPRIIGVQAKGCSPIVNSFNKGLRKVVETSDCSTIAREIAVPRPLRGKEALEALYESNGFAVVVEDKEILEALRVAARFIGMFVETASAATLAALIQLADEKAFKVNEKIVVIVTGLGFKDTRLLVRDLEEMNKFSRTALEILEILSLKRMHGYAIWKIISKRRNVTLANIYYHLKRLEAAGLIARESFKERKVYFITSKGIAFLRNLKSKLNVLSEDLNKVV